MAKAGSTSLQRWFAGNPHVDYCEGGLGGFADVYDLIRRSASPGPEAVLRVTSSEGLAAPQASFGLVDADQLAPQPLAPADARSRLCSTLKDLFGDAAILIVTRGFRGLLLSNYSQFVRQGGALSAGEVFLQVEKAIDAGSNPFNIDATFAAFARAFGRGNVILLPYELLRDAPEAFLRTLEERTGLPRWSGSLQRVNEALSPAELLWYPRLARAAARWPLPGAVTARTLRLLRRPRVAERLQRLRPGMPPSDEAVPASLLAKLGGCASVLRAEPLYAPYATDYFL